MVARVWHGYCPTREHADAYEAMLKPELLPGISKKKGYRGSHLLRRDLGHAISNQQPATGNRQSAIGNRQSGNAFPDC
jgi:hypothetical protein